MRGLFKKSKRALGLVLTVALLGGSMNFSALQVTAEEQAPVIAVLEDYVLLPEMETSAMPIGWFSLENGIVTLKPGNWDSWYEQLDLSDAAFATSFYEDLVEASDNDGVDDWLIEDDGFSQKSFKIDLAVVKGTAASVDEVSIAMSDILQRYSVYVMAVTNAFDRDHPEVFWLSGQTRTSVSASYSGIEGAYDYDVTVYFDLKDTDEGYDVRAEEYRSEAAITAAIAARDARVNALVSATAGMTDYEKLVYFNEQLTKSNQYNTSDDLSNIAHDCRECIGALTGKIGTEGPVCESYARAFKVLCDEAGIPCVLVDGMAKNSISSTGEAHMWNNAKLDGKWYAVDVTWNDPLGGASGAVSGYENKNWLLVGSQTVISTMAFEESHPVSNQVSVNGVKFVNGPVLSESKYVVSDVQPTPTPTAVPTATPTAVPTATPTAVPTVAPTAVPTAVPTVAPTAVPTATPTAVPTVAPTAVPTATPTAVPTVAPTAVPTATPTAVPTVAPTAVPTATPTAVPTVAPTAVPTATPTAVPTVAPTAVPTVAPTAVPTATPTAVPTVAPTAVPTAVPTVAPTAVPTATPTAVPTAAPTAVPTAAPTAVPTAAPTAVPTVAPTAVPTVAPTAVPTAVPTVAPTAVPTATPTAVPTAVPTAAPTAVPTAAPTAVPTAAPTAVPTAAPTAVPTAAPTAVPTAAPTAAPTATQAPTADGKTGWPEIKQQTATAKTGDRVVVQTNGNNIVPGSVISELKGKNADLFLNLGNGISWTISGQNIKEDNIKDINFAVILENDQTKINNIPQNLIKDVANGKKYVNMSLVYDGDFGFTGTLHINLKAENAGKYANLYYYNETTGKLEFVCSAKIGAEGITSLPLTHASEYTIVLSDTPMQEVEVTIASPKTGDDWNVTGMLMIGMLVFVIGMFGVVILRRNSKKY